MSSTTPYRRIETLEFAEKSIPESILNDVCPSLKSKSTIKHSKSDTGKNCVEKKITDSSHPAYPAYGLFASRKLTSHEKIIDYHGYVTMNGDEDKHSDFTYCFANRRLVIDANKVGSIARFCNDFRGIRDKPNAEFFEYRDKAGDLKCAIRVRKEIKAIAKGEEICVNYGKGFWVHRFGRDALEKASLSSRVL